MAYTDENNAGFFCTALKYGATAFGGPIGSTLQRIVVKDPVAAGGNNTPVGRPMRLLDARDVFRVLDMSGQIAPTTAVQNTETDVQEVNGTSNGSIIHGPMTPGNADWSTDHGNTHTGEWEFLFKGTALTETTAL